MRAVVQSHRELAAAQARHSALVEEARLAGTALHATDSFTGGPQWSSEMVVERQIITELAVALHQSEGDTRRLLHTSEALADTFGATRAALEAGAISYRHAEKIVQHSQTLPSACIPAYELALLPAARSVTVQRLETLARAALEQAQPTTAVQRHVDAASKRRLYIDPASDGMAYLTQYLPAVEAVAIYNRADDLARSAKNSGDPRTIAQLRLDAVTDLLLNGETSIPTATRGIRARIHVTVPALTLLGQQLPTDLCDQQLPADALGQQLSTDLRGHQLPSNTLDQQLHADPLGQQRPTNTLAQRFPTDALGQQLPTDTLDSDQHQSTRSGSDTLEPDQRPERRATVTHPSAMLEAYGPIDRLTALRLTSDAPHFMRVLTDPATGSVLSYDRTRYKPPADLDELVRLTHTECTFPLSCTPSATADLDHTIAWSDGGATELRNLSPLCTSHHKVKHHTAWQVEQSQDGTVIWTSPAGFAYAVKPASIAPKTPRFEDTPSPPPPF